MNSGLGPVSPNTVLMSWITDWKKSLNQGEDVTPAELSGNVDNARTIDDYADTLKGLINMRRVVCILKGLTFPRCRDKMPRGSTIDIYWVVDDGGICLLMSYILSKSTVWRAGARIRVYVVLTDEDENPLHVKHAVEDFLQQMRIDAVVFMVDLQNTTLHDDFRSNPWDAICPPGAPTMTVEEKFDMNKGACDDEETIASSTGQSYGGGLSTSFTKRGFFWSNPCTPSNMDYTNKPSPTTSNTSFDNNDNSGLDLSLRRESRCLALDTAKKFNNLIRKHSSSADMVVTHLPLLHKAPETVDFMEYVDAMMNDLNNVLLILGAGVEYLTTVA